MYKAAISIAIFSLTFLQIIIFILNTNTYAQSEEIHFSQFSTKNGFSSNRINNILQDSRGFLWFATNMGLHRWDGYEMKVFYHKPDDTSSLSASAICSIYEDEDNILWIGTFKNGLNRFDRNLENFTRYDIGNINPETKNQNTIWAMYVDHHKNFWLATAYGLVKFNRTTRKIQRFVADSTSYSTIISDQAMNYFRVICNKDSNTLLLGTRNGIVQFDMIKETFIPIPLSGYSGNVYEIRGIASEGTGIFWIVSHANGLFRYDSSTNHIQKYIPVVSNAENDLFNGLISICVKSPDEIWVGSTNGLFQFNQQTNFARVFLPSSRDITNISSSIIMTIYLDRDKNLWFGTQDRGVNFLPNTKKPYRIYKWDSENPNSLGRGIVNSICEDNLGNIWIGSWGGGISCFLPQNKNYMRFTTGSPEPYRISSDYINLIHLDNEENIWIGSTGLYLWNPHRGSFSSIAELNNRKVRTICNGYDGDLWIGFKYSGLALYRRGENSFKYFFHTLNDSLSLSDNHVLCMYWSKSGNLWIGTGDGLNLLSNHVSEQPVFTRYYNDPDSRNSISHNEITSIFEDSKERVWIGTKNGLNLFNAEINGFRRIRVVEHLANNIVQKITEDNKGNLWIRWGEKLIRYSHDTGVSRTYDERDGFLPEGEYGSWNAVLYRGKSGIMYYGGVDKFITFDPNELKDNPEPPSIVITNFLLRNKSVKIGEDFLLKKSITETKFLELNYTQNIISFEFAALDYTNPLKNQYAYKMEGVDNEWIYTDANRRFANYTNLDPGEYTFCVKASNSDGIWNEDGISLSIIVNPPWWQTWWAYSAYIVLILATLFLLRRYELHRQQLKHDLALKHEQTEKLQEIDRMKSRFFANISHEIRTPLTLILGPSERILKKTSEDDTKKQAGSIKQNAKRLLGLINQLLDLSKLEAGELKLCASVGNIVSFIKGVTLSFESIAERKDITLIVNTTNEEIEMYFDKDKMVKILSNLLSNAFKYTALGGEIVVSINETYTNSVTISIKDTGIGIPTEEIPKLFDRFYQVDSSQTREHEGTGIGLAHTKELVELHHGTISVDSKIDEWTEFTIELPLGRDHLDNDERVELTNAMEERTIIDEEKILSTTTKVQTEISNNLVDDKTQILLVEDNSDVRKYIVDSLSEEHRITVAENGVEGRRIAEEINPDLIISDIMMPKMDGNELTRLLKNNEKTSHIPIILLTAKSEQESKIEGLKTGADDYLTKPFDTYELLVRINNLIEQRKKLQEKFRREISVSPSDITVTSIDEQLLQRAINAVESNISDSDFDTGAMAKEVGVSRTLLHTKLKALTGQSTGEFIRNLRLKRAAQLFQKGYGNVTQVAYDVGFQNLSYFAKSFRKQFGKSPSSYASQNKD